MVFGEIVVSELAEMAVRVARAELERDAALAEARVAKAARDEAWQAHHAVMMGDQDALLRTLTIVGIPARDLKDIYDLQQRWVKGGWSVRTLRRLDVLERVALCANTVLLAEYPPGTLVGSNRPMELASSWIRLSNALRDLDNLREDAETKDEP